MERGLGEEKYLDPLDIIAKDCKPLAASMVERYNKEWSESVDPLYSPEYTFWEIFLWLIRRLDEQV